jgi:cytochrome c-type biogenesis protein
MLSTIQESLQAAAESGSILTIGMAFIVGILVGFTPCIYPILPITMATIGGLSKGKRRTAFFYSLIYVGGMSLVYCILGVILVLLRGQVGQLWGNGWFLLTMGGFFVVLALWMFKAFAIPMPQIFLKGNKRSGALGAFSVGAVSGLVVGPCTGPGLAAVLALIASAADKEGTGGNLILGIGAMLAYSIGQGSLVILCGTFSGFLANLPKSGNWLNRVEKGFATLMLLSGMVFVVAAGQSGDLPELARVLATFTGSGPTVTNEPPDEPPLQQPQDVNGTEPLVLPPAPTVFSGVGKLAPAWTATDMAGNPVSFDAYRGKKGVLLVFWAKWCAVCYDEVPHLNQLAKQLKNRDVVILGIGSRQNAKQAASFRKTAKPDYSLLLDQKGAISDLFKVLGLPAYVAIDRSGVVRGYGGGLPKDLLRTALQLEHAQEPAQ